VHYGPSKIAGQKRTPNRPLFSNIIASSYKMPLGTWNIAMVSSSSPYYLCLSSSHQ
jgi:hypothetical protein